MILALNEAKTYLRIDLDYTDEDTDITNLITAAEAYLLNATDKTFDSTNQLAKLYCQVLVSDWYENRTLTQESKVSEKVRFTLQSIMQQLKYC